MEGAGLLSKQVGRVPAYHTQNQPLELAMMLENVFLDLWVGGGAYPGRRVAWESKWMRAGKDDYLSRMWTGG